MPELAQPEAKKGCTGSEQTRHRKSAKCFEKRSRFWERNPFPFLGTESVPVFGNVATDQGGRGPKADLPESRSKPKSGTPGVPKNRNAFPNRWNRFPHTFGRAFRHLPMPSWRRRCPPICEPDCRRAEPRLRRQRCIHCDRY